MLSLRRKCLELWTGKASSLRVPAPRPGAGRLLKPKSAAGENKVVFMDMESALTGEYESLVREHFLQIARPEESPFTALNGAMWSGGSFVYVPPGAEVSLPVQSFSRMNTEKGQFEHSLILVDEGASLHFIEGCSSPKSNPAGLHAGCVEMFVGKGAKLRYSAIENWDKTMYNSHVQHALVLEGGCLEWTFASFGAGQSRYEREIVLRGDGAGAKVNGLVFTGAGERKSLAVKAVHEGKGTDSFLCIRSFGRNGRTAIAESRAELSGTAGGKILRTNQEGRVSEEAVFYLMTRGLSRKEARAMLAAGFAAPVTKELLPEYAAEVNSLIHREMTSDAELDQT